MGQVLNHLTALNRRQLCKYLTFFLELCRIHDLFKPS